MRNSESCIVNVVCALIILKLKHCKTCWHSFLVLRYNVHSIKKVRATGGLIVYRIVDKILWVFFMSYSPLIITPQGGLTVSQFLLSWLILDHCRDSAAC